MAGPGSTSCQELANPEDVETVFQSVQTSMSLLQPGSDSCQELLANTTDVGNVAQNVQTSMSLRRDNLAYTSIEGDRNQVFQGCTFNVAFQQTGTTDSSVEKRKMRRTETEETTGFGGFLNEVKNSLTSDDLRLLMTAMEFKPAEQDKVERSEDPGHVFVHSLKRKGMISRTDISFLTGKLKICGLHGVADDLVELFKSCRPQEIPKACLSEEYTENKTQLVKGLQNKYGIWCGETQPAPFLHDTYDLDKLYVPTGITYLEEKHGGQEKWTILKDYKTVFTDPQVKSRRRIIDGGPGYGKSTLALQIAKDWCDGVTPLNQYDIVILLRLRQFKNVPTIYSAIKRFLLPKDSSLTEDNIKDVLDSSSTLFVLDGYDEYPDREKEDTDVNHIIKGDMFQKHEVIVTTRTSCLPPNHTNTTIKRLRLTGFDDDSKEIYVRKAVSRGISDVADTIITFLKVNPVPADLSKIPLFFAMISFMVKISERFRNLTTVTDFFRHIVKCFYSHRLIKTTGGTSGKGQDHSKLDKVAFEGLNGDVQQISWGKENLLGKIGKDLYDEHVSIGILIEEESFDYDTLEYNTETRFFHKLFAEWYAAHHFAKVASLPETEFEPRPKRRGLLETRSYHTEADALAPPLAVNANNVLSLKHLNPDDVHYMYRYACGLNPEAALKIIKHLAKNGDYDKYALLCRTEWGGSFEAIQDTARLLCSRRMKIDESDSLLLQQSTMALIEFASSRKIPIAWVCLFNCLSIDSTGNLRVQPSNLSLPVNDTSISTLWIVEYYRVITEEETDSILQYAAKCRGLKKLVFIGCLLPQYVKKTDSLSVLKSRGVKVVWLSPGDRVYLLNLSSCRWEDYHRCKTCKISRAHTL